GLFFQGVERGLPQFVGEPRERSEVGLKPNRRVSIDDVDSVRDRETCLGKVAAMQAADDGTAAEGVGELLFERVQQILVRQGRHVGKVDLNSCLFGQRQ